MARDNDFGASRVEVGPNGARLLKYRVVSLNTNNAALILTGVRYLYGWELSNVNAAFRYVKLYDKATAPTVGTDVPVLTLGVPTGWRSAEKLIGIPFSLGLGIGIVTGAADSDNTAVAAGEVIAHILYS
jgi:hypothetical protein